jgi:pantoate kinase
MTVAFSQGHVTCIFRPVRTDDPRTTGSRGIGMRLERGAWAAVEERRDGKTVIAINGKEGGADVTGRIVPILAPGRGFDISVTTELPVSQGFGMSAAGTIAAGLCICEILGTDPERAYDAAHIAEVQGGGGLGDVAGIMCDGPIAVRTVEGIPSHNKMFGTGEEKSIVLAVVGGTMATKDVLRNSMTMERIIAAGDELVRPPFPCCDRDLVCLSRDFSSLTGLETPEVSAALAAVPMAGMCMLGNSIFALCRKDAVADALPDADVIGCFTTEARPFIRKA